jgi:hypothetical protein
MARKPRSDSPLKSLRPETRDEVARLCAAHGYARAIKPVKELTGLTAGVSVSSLSRFHSWHRLSTALERNRDDAAAFEELLKGRDDLAVDAQHAREIAQVYFERRVLAADDPQLYFAWLKERREAEKQRLDREKLDLERDKFERLVLSKLDDLLQVREAADSKGLRGEDAVEAVRRALWGEEALR